MDNNPKNTQCQQKTDHGNNTDTHNLRKEKVSIPQSSSTTNIQPPVRYTPSTMQSGNPTQNIPPGNKMHIISPGRQGMGFINPNQGLQEPTLSRPPKRPKKRLLRPPRQKPEIIREIIKCVDQTDGVNIFNKQVHHMGKKTQRVPGQSIRRNNPGAVRARGNNPDQFKANRKLTQVRHGNPSRYHYVKKDITQSNDTKKKEEPNEKLISDKRSQQILILDALGFDPTIPPPQLDTVITCDPTCDTIPPGTIGQWIPITKQNEHENLIQTGTSQLKPRAQSNLGALFKPIPEAEKPQQIDNMIQDPPNTENSGTTDGKIMALVGKPQKVDPVNQQKKILKFQMRMQAMQQEKRQTMMTRPVKATDEPKFINTFVSADPVTPHTMYHTPPPSTAVPVTRSALTQINLDGQSTSATAQTSQQSQTPQTETVETAFTMDPTSSYKLPPQPGISGRLGQWTTVNQYGFIYPKGVPKSFLLQQHLARTSKTPSDAPIWPNGMVSVPTVQPATSSDSSTSPLLIQTDVKDDTAQPYSPSELYTDMDPSHSQDCEDSESSELSQSGQKRLSAFRRLGPQTQPKRPKLTISVTVNDDQEVREVVDETEDQEEITPVHLREDMMLSKDETIVKYFKSWPWRKNVTIKRSVTARYSKTLMMLEREQMEEVYDKDTLFVQVTVKGYPPSWKKEQVLDVVMENVRGYSFIPCFIDFTRESCRFLTLRCRGALLSLHRCGLQLRRGGALLALALAHTDLTLHQLDFVPRLVLRTRLNMCAAADTKLDLTAFTLKEDISHFIYYPLHRLNNQVELVQLQSDITWANITELNLSHNRITSIEGFDLEQTTPRLKHLDLSHNYLEKVTHLLICRQLPLRSIRLEGNPLCLDYIDPHQYMKVVKMIFSSLVTIDDVPVKLKGEMPKIVRNYCPSDAKELVDKFLDVYFPLLDGDIEHRAMLQDMYEDNATMTITYNYKLAFGPIYRCFQSLFQHARQFDQGNTDMVKGSMGIIKTIVSWPYTEHDPFTFTVDVLYDSESTTIIRVDGIFKLTRESLADDEYLLSFSRTLVLHTRDLVEYKIQSEMVHWSAPTGAYAKSAFAVTTVKTKQMNPKIDSTTDPKLQMELVKIFMKLTSMDKRISERCLELKKWNLKEALDHFTELLKLDCLDTLLKEVA